MLPPALPEVSMDESLDKSNFGPLVSWTTPLVSESVKLISEMFLCFLSVDVDSEFGNLNLTLAALPLCLFLSLFFPFLLFPMIKANCCAQSSVTNRDRRHRDNEAVNFTIFPNKT